MQNEIAACYWKYIVSGNVRVYMFKRTKECNFFFFRKNYLLVNCFYFNLYNFKFASKNDYAICLALILS